MGSFVRNWKNKKDPSIFEYGREEKAETHLGASAGQVRNPNGDGIRQSFFQSFQRMS